MLEIKELDLESCCYLPLACPEAFFLFGKLQSTIGTSCPTVVAKGVVDTKVYPRKLLR